MSKKQHLLAASLIVATLISILPTPVWGNETEAEVRSTIQAFYNAFNDGFTQPAGYAAED